MNIIEAVDLSYKENNEEIIKSVNLNVHTGDIYGLLDLCGFTKAAFVKLFLGKVKPSQGYFIIKGIDIKSKKKIKCLVSSSYKLPKSCKFFSGYACLVFYAMLYKTPKRRVDEVFELLGLLKVKNKRVSKYSLCMKKRLVLARALLRKSEVIVIEQPTKDLDQQGVIEIKNLLKELIFKENKTFIICSESMEEIMAICNRGAILKEGNLLYEGDINKVSDFSNFVF